MYPGDGAGGKGGGGLERERVQVGQRSAVLQSAECGCVWVWRGWSQRTRSRGGHGPVVRPAECPVQCCACGSGGAGKSN